ncbi:MAG: Fic family protein [Holosporales bacterium]|nr:Fic family protein [Holosporales bacterium]
MILYIQPFEDGNKRTSRVLANAILLAYGYCLILWNRRQGRI